MIMSVEVETCFPRIGNINAEVNRIPCDVFSDITTASQVFDIWTLSEWSYVCSSVEENSTDITLVAE